MTELSLFIADNAPGLVGAAGADSSTKFLEFFAAPIRNANTRRAYVRERAAVMANHSSTRTKQLYDRRPDNVTLDEFERVLI